MGTERTSLAIFFLGIILILWMSSCVPTQTIVTIKGDRAEVKRTLSLVEDTILYRDSTFYDVPIDSINYVLLDCENQTFAFSEKWGDINIKYPTLEGVRDKQCPNFEFNPSLTVNFPRPVTTIEGPLKNLSVSLDQKQIIFPINGSLYRPPTAEYTISMRPRKPNYRLRKGLDFIGFYADIPAGAGPGWYLGNDPLIPENYLSINVLSFGFVLDKVRAAYRVSILEIEMTDDLVPIPGYDFISFSDNEISLGYQLFDSDYFTLTPSVLGSLRGFEYTDSEDELEDLDLGNEFMFGLSLNIDFRFQQLFRNKVKREEKKYEYLFLRIEGGWYPDPLENPIGVSGDLILLNFAISAFIGNERNTRRVKPME